MDLGRTNKQESPTSLPTKDEPKTVYPSFDMRDEVADNFAKEYDCEVGDEITAKVKLRVSGIRKDEYGSSKTFEVLTIDDVQETGESDEPGEKEEGDDAEEKVLGYKRPQKNSAPPDTSAAEMEE